jgi:hypothetical protein
MLFPLPLREGDEGEGLSNREISSLLFHPHPIPLPSRERVIFSIHHPLKGRELSEIFY